MKTLSDLKARKHAQLGLQHRESKQAMYNCKRYRRARKAFLHEQPFCVHCEARGKTVPATVLDHITPHCGDESLFWDADNWQALCVRCHNVKSNTDKQR